jgi:hypothetical protein
VLFFPVALVVLEVKGIQEILEIMVVGGPVAAAEIQEMLEVAVVREMELQEMAGLPASLDLAAPVALAALAGSRVAQSARRASAAAAAVQAGVGAMEAPEVQEIQVLEVQGQNAAIVVTRVTLDNLEAHPVVGAAVQEMAATLEMEDLLVGMVLQEMQMDAPAAMALLAVVVVRGLLVLVVVVRRSARVAVAAAAAAAAVAVAVPVDLEEVVGLKQILETPVPRETLAQPEIREVLGMRAQMEIQEMREEWGKLDLLQILTHHLV